MDGLGAAKVAPAAPGTPTVDAVASDPEIKRLKVDQARAEVRKAIAEANKATVAAQLPSVDAKPPDGKVEVGDNAGMVADAVARALLEDAARRIATESSLGKGDKVLVVEDRLLIATDWQYRAVEGRLRQQIEALDTAKRMVIEAGGRETEAQSVQAEDEPAAAESSRRSLLAAAAVPGLVAAAPGVLGAVAQVAGLFRSDYALSSREVTIGATPLVAAVTGELLREGKAVILDGFSLLKDSSLLADFAAAQQARVELERLTLEAAQGADVQRRAVDDARSEREQAATAHAKAAGEGKGDDILAALRAQIQGADSRIADLEQQLAGPEPAIAFAKMVAEAFDGLAAALVTASDGAVYPPLIAAATREALHGDQPKATHVLFLSADGASGETITKRGWFGGTRKIRFVGGLQTSFLLLDAANNTTKAAGAHSFLGDVDYKLGDGDMDPMRKIDLTVKPTA
jgi:hypothetical protein